MKTAQILLWGSPIDLPKNKQMKKGRGNRYRQNVFPMPSNSYGEGLILTAAP